MFEAIKEPRSTLEKTNLAKGLYKAFTSLRDAKDIATWEEGRLLYYFDKFGLHNYLFGKALTKKSFYSEIDIPLSTADFKKSLYDFYVVKHGFTLEDLRKSNTKKLHRALAYIKDWKREEVENVLHLAERERESLGDFLALVGAPIDLCIHDPMEDRVIVCKKCGRKLVYGKHE